jgi:S-adenosylmethionine:tRNA ribosyltransferase-isomerase
VFNDTRVIRARLFGRKESGGQIEVLIERIVDARHAVAQIRASKSPKAGSRIFSKTPSPDRRGRSGEQGEFFALELAEDGDLWTLIERHGRLPLPPYITHAAGSDDEARYQTVFARHPGAVAAPTAGLHFDAALLAQLAQCGVEVAWLTLHVGAGTFQPVRVQPSPSTACTPSASRFRPPPSPPSPARAPAAAGRRRRDDQSARARSGCAARRTARRPGRDRHLHHPGLRVSRRRPLITNFHLPKSTLLMLVSAFAGSTPSVAPIGTRLPRYRFFSYGDAMLLTRELFHAVGPFATLTRSLLPALPRTCQHPLTRQ